jgi:Mg/Co/Ni transporter MgtE
MTNEFIAYSPELTVKEAMEAFRRDAGEVETVYYIYVVDADERLLGVVSLRELLLSPLDAKLSDIMETKIKVVPPETDEEEVAGVISKYNLIALPVVDSDGVLLGIIAMDDIIDRILPPAAKRRRRKV